MAHLLFVVVLYVLFREVAGSYRIAGIAVLFYSGNALFESFDSMFTYQTLALPFLGLTLLVLGAWGRGQLASGAPVGSSFGTNSCNDGSYTPHHQLCPGGNLVHHYPCRLACRQQAGGAWTAILALLSAGAAASWLFSPLLRPTLIYSQSQARHCRVSRVCLSRQHTSSSPISVGPVTNRILASMAVLTVSGLLPVGWWRVWRRYRGQAWVVAMAIASATWYAVVVVRLTVADGTELSGRAATFIYVPIAYILALALVYLATKAVRWKAQLVGGAVLSSSTTLLFNGFVNGWPPYWERLPGSYQVAGSERSVEPEVIAGASWALTTLGPGRGFALILGATLFLAAMATKTRFVTSPTCTLPPSIHLSDVLRAQAQGLRYIWVDRRLSESLPASASTFLSTPTLVDTSVPLSVTDLDKFNTVPGLDRIYDSGNIVYLCAIWIVT